MYGSDLCVFSIWWIVPLIMMILCFLVFRRRCGSTICGVGQRCSGGRAAEAADAAIDILDRRYASGHIYRAEYEEKKRLLVGPVDPENERTPRTEGETA